MQSSRCRKQEGGEAGSWIGAAAPAPSSAPSSAAPPWSMEEQPRAVLGDACDHFVDQAGRLCGGSERR
jgi:hypothetical protein